MHCRKFSKLYQLSSGRCGVSSVNRSLLENDSQCFMNTVRSIDSLKREIKQRRHGK